MTLPSVLESDVPCPTCGKPICQYCAFNKLCQHCGTTLSRKSLAAFDAWWDEHRPSPVPS